MPRRKNTALQLTGERPPITIHPRLEGKTFVAFAVVKEPSDGDGWTTARLYKFKVRLEDAQVCSESNMQDIILERVRTQMEDALVESGGQA